LQAARPWGSTPSGTNRITNLDNFNLFLTELALRLVPLLVPLLCVLLLSTCDIIHAETNPLKRNAVSLGESMIPVFGGCDTKLQALSIARKLEACSTWIVSVRCLALKAMFLE
jgi:hypothetical protein